MARLTPLSTLVRMLKAAVGDSLTIGTQVDALYKQLLSDKQQWMAGEYDFPFLRDRWNVNILPNTRYYAFPTTTTDGTQNIQIDFERPVRAYTSWTNQWIEAPYGIDELEEYNSLNPDTNLGGWAQEKLDPVQRWQFNGESQFEVWPIPTVAQFFRFVGQRVLNPLVADNDTADLDDQFLVLETAVDILAKGQNSQVVQLRMASALQRLKALRSVYPCRDYPIALRGGMRMSRKVFRRVPIVTIAGAGGQGNGSSQVIIGDAGGGAIGPVQ